MVVRFKGGTVGDDMFSGLIWGSTQACDELSWDEVSIVFSMEPMPSDGLDDMGVCFSCAFEVPMEEGEL